MTEETTPASSDAPRFAQGVVSWRQILGRAVILIGLVGWAAVLIGVFFDRGFSFVSIIMSSAGAVVVPVMLMRTGVLIDHRGVQVWSLAEAARGAWRWEELREICLARQGGPWALGVRPRGSVWDVPGPSAPSLPPIRGLRDEDRRQRLASVLTHYTDLHGIPFTRTADGLGSAPPGHRLRSDS